MPKWPDEHIELLKTLAATSKSSSTIADEINWAYPGSGYNRNAIIGKLNRMKIGRTHLRRYASAPEPTPKRSTPFFREPKAPNPQKATKSEGPNLGSKPPHPLPAVPEPVQDTQPVSIMELERHMCRMIVSDAPTLYCGAPTDLTYCPVHKPRSLGVSQGRRSIVPGKLYRPRNQEEF